MTIANDWCTNFTAKVISHVDGIINYDTNTGTAPSLGNYLRFVCGSCTAVGQIIAGSDLGGSCATGTLTLTNIVGQIGNNFTITVLDRLPFDTVSNCGFAQTGISLFEGCPGTAEIAVRAVEYNFVDINDNSCDVQGAGRIYGCITVAAFTNNDTLRTVSSSGTQVAIVDGCETLGSTFTGALVNEATNFGPAPVGCCNRSQLLNFDCCGTQVFVPEGARIACSACACPAEEAIVQVHTGPASGSTGTLTVRCVNPAWVCNDNIFLRHVVFFDALVAGQVFSAGDVITGATCCGTARVLQVVCDGDCTGKLITAGVNNACGALTENAFMCAENITVGGVVIAEVENATFVLDSFTDVLGAPRLLQRSCQGGLYDVAVGINTVRNANALYTHLQDTFDEVGQLDDNEPMTAQVKDGQYTLINCWKIPDLSMRFLSSGSVQTSDNNCIFTNYQTLGTIEDVSDIGFAVNAGCPTPQPNLYVEQNAVVLRQDWLEGNVDILIKVKTKQDTQIICTTVTGLGQLINCGTVTIFDRSFFNTYDHFCTTTIGGTSPIPLNTANDLNCCVGQHSYIYGAGGCLTVGEEIVGGTSGAIGIVACEDLVCNIVTFALKSTAQFAMCEVVTGSQSGATTTINCMAVVDIVAGYCTTIRVAYAQESFTGGTVAGGKFQTGEPVTQAGSGATGFIVGQDQAGTTLVVENCCGTFNMCGAITDTVGCSTYTPTATASTCTVSIDLGDGSGNHVYNAAIGADVDAMCGGDTILRVYNWTKYLTRKEECTVILGNTGATTGLVGQIYRRLVGTYPEVKVAPFGSFAGGSFFGAQGVYIDKCDLATADLQNIQLIDTSGTIVNPPNLQTLSITSLIACDSVGVYRAQGGCACGACDNQAADTTIVVGSSTRTVPLCVDVPTSGVLRVQDPCQPACTLVYLRFPYNAVNRCTNTFTLTSGTIGTVTSCMDLRNDDDVFVAFICEDVCGTTACTSIQFLCNIPLLIRVREKGILPFETTGTFNCSGFSTGAIRTTDTIVDLP